ncbi:MAG: hypothetical protein Tsb0013_02150 [Phycisphaerales bacterium]
MTVRRRLIAGITLLCAGSAHAQITYRTAAQVGVTAPDTTFSFFSLGTPVINRFGAVAFRASVLNTGTSGPPVLQGVWGEFARPISQTITFYDLRNAALQGSVAPSPVANTVFTSFADAELSLAGLGLHLDQDGRVSFLATIDDPMSPNDLIGQWRSVLSQSAPVLVADIVVSGDAAPGVSDEFVGINFGATNRFGYKVFGGTYNSGILSGLWGENPVGVFFVSSGDSDPALRPNLRPVINDLGVYVYPCLSQDPTNPSNDLRSLCVGAPGLGTFVVASQRNEVLPGLVIDDFQFPGFNNAGTIAVRVTLREQGTTAVADPGIFLFDAFTGASSKIVRVGESHPSLGVNEVFLTVDDPVINQFGVVAFTATVGEDQPLSPKRTSLWRFDPNSGSLDLLAEEGVTISQSGEILGSIGIFAGSSASDVSINRDGHIAFLAGAEVPAGVQPVGLWLYDPSLNNVGGVRKIALENNNASTIIPLQSGPLSAPQVVLGSGGQDGRQTGLGDGGELAFNINYGPATSRVLVATVGAIASTCTADLNNDFFVDLGDFGVFGQAFDSVLGDSNYDPAADLDLDGDVDLGDFGIFGAQFGNGPAECDPNDRGL